MEQVTVTANANIALCKYWGKSGPGNAPATPSIALTLEALTTTSTIRRSSHRSDQLVIDGRNDPAANLRVSKHLDLWRSLGLIDGHFSIESSNSFPTASGLASSSSGFAALASALSMFANRKLRIGELSRLARCGSCSAARSITGGLSALPAGLDPAARLLAPAKDLPWSMAVAVVTQESKQISSRAGMKLCEDTSLYYQDWLIQARRDYRKMLGALNSWDINATGELMEANTLSMHGCMLGARPPLVYWTAGTLEVLHKVADWRRQGLDVFATTDAGSNVCVLCHNSDLPAVGRRLKRIHGVLQVVNSRAGGGPQVVDSK